MERRRQTKRLGEKRDLRFRRLGNQSLDVLFERRQRWRRSSQLFERNRGFGNDTASEPAVDAQHVAEWAFLDELRRDASGIEANGPHAHRQILALQLELADDNVCGADDLAEADDGGVTQAGDRRHPQALECAQPILAPESTASRERPGRRSGAQRMPRSASRPAAPRWCFRRERQDGARHSTEPTVPPMQDGQTPVATPIPKRSGTRDADGSRCHSVAPIGRISTTMRHCPAPVARHCSVSMSTSTSNRRITRRIADR